MSKVKLLITVSGGVVTGVDASIDMDVVILDYDDQDSEEPVLVSEIHSPETIIGPDGFFFKLFKEEETDLMTALARDQLRALNF